VNSAASSPAQRGGRAPLLWIAFAFAGGIWFSAFHWRPPVWWIIAACGFLFFSFHLSQRRPMFARVLGLGAVFAAGSLCLQLWSASTRTDSTILELADGGEVTVTAHVL